MFRNQTNNCRTNKKIRAVRTSFSNSFSSDDDEEGEHDNS